MSIAIDRMTAADRQAISESLLTDTKPHKSEEWGAHCPFHSEETPGGAFFYNFEIDTAFCHSCGANSDLVGIFNAVNGRDPSDPAGCAEFVERFCNGSTQIQRQPRRTRPRGWAPKKVGLPSSFWMERAASFVEHSVERLQSSPERLAELEWWGIDRETALKCRFGWNDRDKYPPVTSWGLPYAQNDKGKEKKNWLPEGLVIPAVYNSQVIKLKIRRPNAETSWGEPRRYWEVVGGANNLFHVYGSHACKVWVLMETERDAALVWKHVHDQGIGAMGCGGAAKRPAGFVADILGRSRLILNALDFDNAGAANTYNFWEKEFPVAVRWPAPPSMGKDVGDALGAGLDVREWVLEGVPGFIKRKLGGQDRGAPVVHSVSKEVEVSEKVHPKTYFDEVLEMMETIPLWREELMSFRDHLQASRFKIFMGVDGRPWVGVKHGVDVTAEAVRLNLCEVRERFHSWRVLDELVGESSLEDIVLGYFGDTLEVRE